MATEPVARGRVVENEEVFDGYALERSCEGEQDDTDMTCAYYTETVRKGTLSSVAAGDALPTRIACSEETCLSSFYDNGCKDFERILVDGKHR
eukprot:COSAG03_NODE_6586_length_1033_cov_1.166489_2_plen_93_part_00